MKSRNIEPLYTCLRGYFNLPNLFMHASQIFPIQKLVFGRINWLVAKKTFLGEHSNTNYFLI